MKEFLWIVLVFWIPYILSLKTPNILENLENFTLIFYSCLAFIILALFQIRKSVLFFAGRIR